MIRIFEVEEAQSGILDRTNALDLPIPQRLLDGIAQIFGDPLTPEQAVDRILQDIRQRGDEALRDWTHKIDGVALDELVVSERALQTAVDSIPSTLRTALELSAQRIRAFHNHQPLTSWTTHTLGGVIGQRIEPLERVGVYVPGGTAPLPSSLLMAVIPAQVAGVKEIVVATPPNRQTGEIPAVILAAAHIAGIQRVYKLGGAQAIGALAYGTASIPQVDKIVGPGNIFVTLAKKRVYGTVGIDGIYGPTETVVVADETASPDWIAADLLAQAEHDVLASAILLTPSAQLAKEVQLAVQEQMTYLTRSDTIAIALENRGGIVVTQTIEQATQLASDYAPEHLCIIAREQDRLARLVKNAGGIFFGERSFEVLGDYVAGPSHIMPTSGTARFASPLSAVDFVKIISIIQIDDASAKPLSLAAATIAEAEELTAHAQAARFRAES